MKKLTQKPFHSMMDCSAIRTCWHEAGHALMAMLHDRYAVSSVSYVPTKINQMRKDYVRTGYLESIAGICKYDRPHYFLSKEVRAVICASGMAAECILLDCHYDDLDCFEEHYYLDEFGDRDYFLEYSGVEGSDLDEHMELFVVGVEKASRILRPHKDSLRRLARVLLKEHYVLGSEIPKICPRFPVGSAC